MQTTVVPVSPPVTGELGPLQALGRLVEERVGGVRAEEGMDLTFRVENVVGLG